MIDALKSRLRLWLAPGARAPAEAPLAVLDPTERERVNESRRLIAERVRELELMSQGANAYWWQLRTKYKLPSDIDYVPETGEVFEGKKRGG